MKALEKRLKECGLQMHALKAKLVYCKNSNRVNPFPNGTFDFLGYTFKPRQAQNSNRKETFTNCLAAVNIKAMKSMNKKMHKWEALRKAGNTIQEIANRINPVLL